MFFFSNIDSFDVTLNLPLDENSATQLNVVWTISASSSAISYFNVQLFVFSNNQLVSNSTINFDDNKMNYSYTFMDLTSGENYHAAVQSVKNNSPPAVTEKSHLIYSNKQKTSKLHEHGNTFININSTYCPPKVEDPFIENSM